MLRVPAVDKARPLDVDRLHRRSCSSAPDGKVSAIGSVIRDETARFNDERALKKRVAELEAQAGRESLT